MNTMTRREREKEQTREQILSAAEGVFARNGFHKTTMDAIAAESEWSKGALYLHFKSKEELFFSILLEKLDTFARLQNTAIEEVDTLEQAVQTLINEQFKFYTHNKQFFQLIHTEQGRVMSASDEGFREKLFVQQKIQIETLSKHLNRLLPLDSTITSLTLILSVFGAINAHMMSWMHTGGQLDLEAAEKEIITLFLKGAVHAE